jgi:cholesterol transport system auxiliary component
MTPLPLLSRRMLAGVVTLAIAGCARLFVNPPPEYIFRLTPVAKFPPELEHVAGQLRVDAPTASAALDWRRIALTKGVLRLDYFADSEWSDVLTDLVQTVLVNSFQNSGAITAITGSLGLSADFILATEIRHFEAQYGAGSGPPDVWVAIEAQFVAMPAREVVVQALFQRHVPAATNDLPSIATAFDQALDAVIREIVVWTVTAAAMPGRRQRL